MARLRIKRYGTRTEVMNGTARMTQGRLTKIDFTYNEYGYIVSKRKSKLMKGKENPLRKLKLLQNKKQFGKKGNFGPLKIKNNKKTKSNKKNNKTIVNKKTKKI
tara:strand:- start:84 stop:395 length:312 start_codon:yes stop_codon:yes gene_type:complete